MFIEPVFGKKFFGREKVLATLHKRVNAIKGGYRQNLALTGPMLTGKSSILRQFLKNIKDTDVVPLYVDMTDADFDVFCIRFMATLLYQYLKSEGHKPDNDFDELLISCRAKVPATVRKIESICRSLVRKKDDEAFEMLLDLTSVFRSESGKSCVVILDEFHNLSTFHLKRPFQVFGKFIMVQKNTMYIVSSSQKTLLKDILSKKLSLLFGNFEVIGIRGFDPHTARSFISDKSKDVEVPENIKNYIIQLSQGNPFYLEVILKRISEIAKTRTGDYGDKECLLDALADLMYESDGILNQYFTNNINFFLEKKNRRKFIPILVALSRGKRRIKSIQQDLGKTDRKLGSKLDRLKNMDLVYKSGVFYKIQDKLFEYWMRNVYSMKMGALVDDVDIKYLEFKNLVEEDFRRYCDFGSRDIVEILCDLFGSFGNEKIKLRMHEKVMPLFSSFQKDSLSGGAACITAKTGKNAWVCHIRKEGLTEEQDINALGALKVTEDGMKISRKIIVPLNGMEPNAFLLAKEYNVWVWDIQQLNRILRLYGSFELVL